MKKTVLAVIVLMLAAFPVFAQVDFVLNALLAALVIDTEGNKFSATGEDGRISMSEIFAMPNISGGAGTEMGNFYVDLTGGAGLLINDSFRSFLLQAMLAASYQASESFDIGPHAGLIYFIDPSWVENDDVAFDDTPGFLLGVGMSMGDRIRYLISLDLISAKFDAEPAPGVQTTDDDFKLTGIGFQFGVRGEF